QGPGHMACFVGPPPRAVVREIVAHIEHQAARPGQAVAQCLWLNQQCGHDGFTSFVGMPVSAGRAVSPLPRSARASVYVRQTDSRPEPMISAMPAQASGAGRSPQNRTPIRAAKMMVMYCSAAVNRVDPKPKARVMASWPT